jgi:hypothetical protein
MRMIAGALVLGFAVVAIPLALVTVPAAAVRDMEVAKPAVASVSTRAHCDVGMGCLR